MTRNTQEKIPWKYLNSKVSIPTTRNLMSKNLGNRVRCSSIFNVYQIALGMFSIQIKILKIRIKWSMYQSPLPWGQGTLVSEMLAKIHFLLIIPYTRHALGIIIFNGMTKQDLCPSEEWPRHFTAEWEKISRNRRKLCLWWQNVLSEKSDIQILVLYEIMHLMVIRNVTLSISTGNSLSSCISGGADPKIPCLSSFQY